MFFAISFSIVSAQEVLSEMKIDTLSAKKTLEKAWNTDPLSPAKAAFYSAILPGLGQAYNKSYWKIPIVYGALGTGIYFYQRNDKQYKRYRDAYKRRLDGFTDDEFYGDRADGRPRLSDEGLRSAQKFYQRNKEISLLVTVGLYALNIIEANVDAHLKQFNIDENLSVEPHLDIDPLDNRAFYGASLTFKF